MKMRKRIITSVVSALVLLLMFAGTAKAAFQYEHDPMQNPDAAADIIVNPDAVYGYSPNPDSGSLRDYAVYDWSDQELVAAAKQEREEYHASIQEKTIRKDWKLLKREIWKNTETKWDQHRSICLNNMGPGRR